MTTETRITDPARWLEAHPEIESVIVAVCDLNGGTRGKRLPVSQVHSQEDPGQGDGH